MAASEPRESSNSMSTAKKTTTTADSTAPAGQAIAVIDIGATSIRMAIGQVDAHEGVRTISTLTQAVSLGRDTFSGGSIRKSTMEDCVRVLRSYRQVLEEHAIVDADHIRVVATSAVREARNRLAFIDRIYIATGLEVEPIDEAEVNRVTFLGVQRFLIDDESLCSAHTIVTEVGGGSTELLMAHEGNVLLARSFRIGSLRLRRSLESYNAPSGKIREIMSNQIQRMADEVLSCLPSDNEVRVIALGGDVRFAARHLLPDVERHTLSAIPLAALSAFTDDLLSLSVDRVVSLHDLSYPDAESVGPALLTYVLLAKTLGINEILVSDTNLRDGLLYEMAVSESWTDEFRQQIHRSALSLGRRYEFDQAHAEHVAYLAGKLFVHLQPQHHLDRRHEVILQAAGLLHEIGAFVSYRSMHKHSLYLIRNSEIFGFGKRNLLLVALVARYHRRASPQASHEGYSELGRDDRVAVAQLAAILRVAVALDESRSQRIRDFSCTIDSKRLIISVPNVDDLSLEQMALRQNGSLFEEVFGWKVLLRIADSPI